MKWKASVVSCARRPALGLAVSVVCLCAVAVVARDPDSQPTFATGIVFDDANRNDIRDAGEAGLPDVRVSNGREIVPTDRDGRYRLPIGDDTIIFVIKPRGWMTPVSSNQLPRFYYNHKPAGSPPSKSPYPGVAPTGSLPASIDFALHKQAEPDRFEVLILGDTQPNDHADIGFLSHDVLAELIGTSAKFGVTLGDLVYDNLSLHEPLAQAVGRIGVPWYNVLGNHDRNYGSGEQRYFDESFERVFGPSTYAFEYGPVHFLVLNDVQEAGDEKYVAGLGATQLEFIANYLGGVPRDELVVLLAHIPIGELKEPERRQLFDLLQPRPRNLILAAHYHYQEHVFLGPKEGWNVEPPLHQLINVTACGSWWTGAPDELGIPHTTMPDGAPNGYSVITFERNTYTIRFKAARSPTDYQMNIYASDELPAAADSPAEVLVNVFFGSWQSVVEMRVDQTGPWVRLEPVRRPDPNYARLKALEEAPTPPPGKKLPKAVDSPHLWRGELPPSLAPGAHVLCVRTTDMFGQTYTAQRIVRVRAGEEPKP